MFYFVCVCVYKYTSKMQLIQFQTHFNEATIAEKQDKHTF